MAESINIVITDDTPTIQIVITGGIIQQSNSLSVVSGFLVDKGSGNVGAGIEVGDYIAGWIADVYVAGKVLTIPVTDVSDLGVAVQGEIL